MWIIIKTKKGEEQNDENDESQNDNFIESDEVDYINEGDIEEEQEEEDNKKSKQKQEQKNSIKNYLTSALINSKKKNANNINEDQIKKGDEILMDLFDNDKNKTQPSMNYQKTQMLPPQTQQQNIFVQMTKTNEQQLKEQLDEEYSCLLYTSPSPRDQA
eukprot:TRINITY_DN29567_c0_g1_i1.p1 TRINITY_DN29567_c0_g1~~TRINITY_DN29567_c0_g1_i1.p1  ORF type:complete len:159 (-),score=51.30 TRINITY_DN29567_c0_g1_i1:125-601(-)